MAISTYPNSRRLKDVLRDLENNLQQIEALLEAADTDDFIGKLMVSIDDATQGYLNGKLTNGAGIQLTENNDGANETLTAAIIAATETAKGKMQFSTSAEMIVGTDEEKAAHCAGFLAALNASGAGATMQGLLVRPKFEYHNADEIKIGAGAYWIPGLGQVKFDAQQQYQLTTLVNGSWSYVYIDYSSLSAAGAITTANLYDSVSAPSFDSTKMGWFSGDDRCIWASRGTGANTQMKFYHDGNDYVQFYDLIDNTNQQHVGNYLTHTLTLPAFSKGGYGSFYTTTSSYVKWYVDSITDRSWFAARYDGTDYHAGVFRLITNDSKQIKTYHNNATGWLQFDNFGFYFGNGI
jgi:hypothetical protein